jgi:hypothetical protein
MNRRSIQIFAAFAIMVVLTAAVLVRVRANYKLGNPGVKLANLPSHTVIDGRTNAFTTLSVPLPESPLDFSSTELMINKVELDMLPPDTLYGRRLYTNDNGLNMIISVVLMGTDRTSIHKPQYCLIGQGHNILDNQVITVPIKGPQPYDLQVMKLRTISERRGPDGRMVPLRGLFLYWFVADGQLTPHHGERMWLMGKDLLLKGLLQRWAYVTYWSICLPEQEEQLLAQMKELIAATVPEFQVTTGTAGPTPVVELNQNDLLVKN